MSGELKYVIGDFEGPLDLLLHLLQTQEVEISGLSILSITEQYLAAMSELELEGTSEFVLMASQLVLMKARYLNKGEIEYETSEDDPMLQLVEKLKLYKEIKRLGEYLKERENPEYHFFKDSMDYVAKETEISMDVQLLTEALTRVLDNLSRFDENRREFFRFQRKHFISVREKAGEILKLLGTTKRLRFSDLCQSRDEAIAAFLSLLELLKLRKIVIVQEEHFSEILIESNQDQEMTSEEKTELVHRITVDDDNNAEES